MLDAVVRKSNKFVSKVLPLCDAVDDGGIVPDVYRVCVATAGGDDLAA